MSYYIQAPTFESTLSLSSLFFLVYKLFYALCYFFYLLSLILIFSTTNILHKTYSRHAIHIIGTHLYPWCCQLWAFLFLICHVFFWVLCFWHRALFFVIRLCHFDIFACYKILLHLVSNYIGLQQLVHFLVCKCWCFIWIFLYI